MSRAGIRRLARALAILAAAGGVACGHADPARLAVTALPSDPRDGRVRAAFELRNDGGRPLVLDRVMPACGCVAVSLLPAELAPGAIARLEVECRGPRVAGDDVREIALRTSDPRSPETLLRVPLGRAPSAPAPLYLGYVAVGETLVREVAVATPSGDILPRSGPDVAAESLPPAADGTRVVRVRFTPRAAGVVRTAVDLGPAGLMALTAVAYDRVMAFPAEVRVPRPTGATGFPAVTLVAVGEAPLAIGRVEYPPGIVGELRAIVPGRQYRLALSGHGPVAPDAAAIRVHGAGGDDPVLVIPLVAAALDDGARPPA